MMATPAKKMMTMSLTTSLAGRSLFKFHDPDPEELPLVEGLDVSAGCVPVPEPTGLFWARTTPGEVLKTKQQTQHTKRKTSRNNPDVASADAADLGEDDDDDDERILFAKQLFCWMPCPILRMGVRLNHLFTQQCTQTIVGYFWESECESGTTSRRGFVPKRAVWPPPSTLTPHVEN
jgi:hypothetical protein